MLAAAAAIILPGKTLAASTSGAGPTHHTVKIQQFVFSPASLPVRTGDRVTWVNLDIVPHTATADDGSWDTGQLVPQASVEIEVTQTMRNTDYCRFHPTMEARLDIA
ncbi:MAG: plastocyanin [Gammaproteobacteria bacterium]|jgi:plastocyanin